MEWRDEAMVIGVRKHGETSVILETMTRGHGRHLGLVRGGRSRTLQPTLQPGNIVDVTWRARLEDHLGQFTVEPLHLHAAHLMQSALSLAAIQLVVAHLRLLPEREADGALYDATLAMIAHLDAPIASARLLVGFELAMLDRLGFGLDLERCALTGARDGLAFVSPKTGRAVTAEQGARWADRLLVLPGFLVRGANVAPTLESLQAAFGLTGHFLARNIYEPRGLTLPQPREAFTGALARALLQAG